MIVELVDFDRFCVYYYNTTDSHKSLSTETLSTIFQKLDEQEAPFDLYNLDIDKMAREATND